MSYTDIDRRMAAASAALPEMTQTLHMQCEIQAIVTLLSRIVHRRRFLNFTAAASTPTGTITSSKSPVLMRGKGAFGGD